MADKKEDEKVEKEPEPVVASPKMYDVEQVGPDGHVFLSKEDIKNRA